MRQFPITSKTTRLILNENELIEKLKAAFPEYETIQFFSEESIASASEMIHSTSVLIGMHGALVILSMFLPQKATLIELFFFGVDPKNYTPYKTVSDLIGVKYKTWTNVREDPPFSIVHDDKSFYLGGIKHLRASPAIFQYGRFQDTFVDVEAVIKLIKEEE